MIPRALNFEIATRKLSKPGASTGLPRERVRWDVRAMKNMVEMHKCGPVTELRSRLEQRASPRGSMSLNNTYFGPQSP